MKNPHASPGHSASISEVHLVIPPILPILSWPLIVYLCCRGRGPEITLIFAVLGGYLFLPVHASIDLPALYELNKISVPAYTALAVGLFAVSKVNDGRASMNMSESSSKWLAGWIPSTVFPRLFIALIVLGTVMTVLTNSDPVIGPSIPLPGLRIYDAASSVLITLIIIIPMLLARKFLAHPEGQRLLLMAFLIGGLSYVPLVLFEVRMSPQINQQLYGFFAHSWIQHVRGSGFRPIVFLTHGLLVSIFLMSTLLVALGLARISQAKVRMKFLAAATVLFVALVLSKSLGALLIAIIFCPLVLFAPRRMLILASACIAIIVILYPILRGTALVPLDSILSFASSINEDRAGSLSDRIYFEELLLARAQERPFFGWGGWGRSLYIGDEEAVPDGQWIIVLGQYGWVGFIGRFGLLVVPIILLFWRWRRDGIGMESAVIAAILAASAVDLLPNSGLTPDKWLLAGALWGRLELGRITAQDPADPAPVSLRLRLRYAPSAKQASTTQRTNRYTRQVNRIKR